MSSFDTRRAIPMQQMPGGLVEIPNVAADLTTTDTTLFQIVLINTTAGALTVTIVDKAAAPKTLFPAVSLPAHSITMAVFPEGLLMTGGINWVASGLGVNAEVMAFKRS